MIQHDRYQTAIYAGLLGVWTLNMTPLDFEPGPFCACAVQAYLPSATTQAYSPGANATDSFNPDSVTQGNCC